MKKRTVGSFDGPFAPMLDLFVKQKQALGYDYVGGYNALHVFDTFSKRYEVKNYELSKENGRMKMILQDQRGLCIFNTLLYF